MKAILESISTLTTESYVDLRAHMNVHRFRPRHSCTVLLQSFYDDIQLDVWQHAL